MVNVETHDAHCRVASIILVVVDLIIERYEKEGVRTAKGVDRPKVGTEER